MLVTKPRPGPEWIHEIKHDGYRLLASKAADRVTLWSRYGTDFTDKLPGIVEAIRSLPIDNALLDGEAVVFQVGGHSDFGALRTKRGAEQAAYVAFDLLQFEREDWRRLPLEVRRAQLESLVAGIDAITFSEAIDEEGAVVFAHACKMGLEGIVSERAGSRYRSGTSRNWLKVLNPDFQRREGLA
jgi:bifunctional non-homologous end joining protein LigD